MKIMGVDISSRSTGWSIIEDNKLLVYGKIMPSGKTMTNAQKMYLFQGELRKIIDDKQPDEIAIEDVVQVRSVSVLKLLARFNGIAIIEAYRCMQKEPELYEPSRWKSAIDGCTGSSKKAEVQNSICKKYNKLSFEKFSIYKKRIDEAKEMIQNSGDSIKHEIKDSKKQLKKANKNKLPNNEIFIIEQKIKSLQEKLIANKKNDKKGISDAFDKISIDIYTETGINDDIADSIGVAIAHQKQLEKK